MQTAELTFSSVRNREVLETCMFRNMHVWDRKEVPVLEFPRDPSFFSIPNMHVSKTSKFHTTERMGSVVVQTLGPSYCTVIFYNKYKKRFFVYSSVIMTCLKKNIFSIKKEGLYNYILLGTLIRKI